MRGRRLCGRLGLMLLFALQTSAHAAHEEESTPQATLAAAAEAISRGAPTEAIDRLELLADRGFVHPDASFNRALAYLARGKSETAQPGDLGRALASMREAEILRPDDPEARRVIEQIRKELERKQARGGAGGQIEEISLSRALSGLLSENTWAILALVFSALTTLGLGLRFASSRRTRSEAGTAAFTGAVLAGVGGLGLLLTGGATALAQSLRQNTKPAVVVVASARLLDAEGRPIGDAPFPEGRELYIKETNGPFARIERSSHEAWIRRSDIRLLEVDATAPHLR